MKMKMKCLSCGVNEIERDNLSIILAGPFCDGCKAKMREAQQVEEDKNKSLNFLEENV